jgi:hypothetical protein
MSESRSRHRIHCLDVRHRMALLCPSLARSRHRIQCLDVRHRMSGRPALDMKRKAGRRYNCQRSKQGMGDHLGYPMACPMGYTTGSPCDVPWDIPWIIPWDIPWDIPWISPGDTRWNIPFFDNCSIMILATERSMSKRLHKAHIAKHL